MGLQIPTANLFQNRVSAFMEDEKLQSRLRYTDTPFGKIAYRTREDFERELVGRFNRQFTACRNFRAGYYDYMWKQCDKSYYGVKKQLRATDLEKGWRSNLKVRHAYKQVESQTSKIVPSVLGFDPPVSVRPNDQNSEWAEYKARAIQQDLRYGFTQKQQALTLVTRWIKQGERLGLSPMLLSWAFEEGPKVSREPMYDNRGRVIGVARIESDNEIIKDWAINTFVDVRHFWWNPDATDPFEDFRYFYREYFKPLSYLQDSPLYQNTDKLVGMRDGLYGEEGEMQRTNQTRFVDTGENMVRVIERWDGKYLMAVGENQLIRYRDNPFDTGILPVYLYRSTIVDDSFVGMGCMEPVLDLEDEANTHLNQRLDNVHRIVHKQIFAGFGAGLKQRRLTFTPGGIHQVRDVNQLKWFEANNVTADAYIEEDRAIRKMDDINGDPEVGRGEGTKSNTTATEVSVRTQGASFRIDLKAQVAQVELGRQYRDRYILNKQFQDPNRVIQVQGETGEWYRWSSAQLYNDEYEFDFTLGGYLGNRLIDFQQFVNGVQVLGQIPPLFNELEPREVVKIFLERSNIRGTERFMRKHPIPMPGHFRDPYDENKRMLMYGQRIIVLPGEDHTKHLPAHVQLYDYPSLPQDTKINLEDHISQHLELFYQSQAQQLVQQQQAAQIPGPAAAANPQQLALGQAIGQAGVTKGGVNAA